MNFNSIEFRVKIKPTVPVYVVPTLDNAYDMTQARVGLQVTYCTAVVILLYYWHQPLSEVSHSVCMYYSSVRLHSPCARIRAVAGMTQLWTLIHAQLVPSLSPKELAFS